MSAQRSPQEIRHSIEANRRELAVSVERLRGEVTRITDWRAHVERHRPEIMAGAAVLGLVVGARMLRRRRRRELGPASEARPPREEAASTGFRAGARPRPGVSISARRNPRHQVNTAGDGCARVPGRSW